MNDSFGTAIKKVDKIHLDSVLKTGACNILSSSALVALMEQAANKALDITCFISEHASVSRSMQLNHIRPSPLGATIKADAHIVDIDHQGIHFDIEAYDDVGLIGTAKHTRVFVNPDEYEAKCFKISRKAKI